MFKIETGVDNPILRKIADRVTDKDFKEAVKLGKKMIKYIKDPENGGVGLAAPQIGVSWKLVVVSMLKDREDENFKTIMLINPEIIEHGTETQLEVEGCLSVPGVKGKVERYNMIKLTYQDDKNNQKTLILHGLQARIIQHELDHINGKLFVDYLKPKKILN
ncbi:MAG: peptide deformylase [Candidatus Gracilibacteria bacterium]|nr:peptide deformylase [Candidatus Gracilibacteria bacterium]